MKAAARAPAPGDRAPARTAHFAAPSRARAAGREEAVHLQRQRVLQLARDRRPAPAAIARAAARSRLLQVADLGRVSRLDGPPRRPVGLQRHLEDHRAADPRRLAEQRRRVGHVLEHVREDPQLVGAVLERQVAPSNSSIRASPRAAPGDLHGRLADLDPRQPPAETAPPQLAPAAPRRRSRRPACSQGRARPARHSSITWSALPTAPSARQRA